MERQLGYEFHCSRGLAVEKLVVLAAGAEWIAVGHVPLQGWEFPQAGNVVSI